MIRRLALELQFPTEAADALEADFQSIRFNNEVASLLDAAVENYLHGDGKLREMQIPLIADLTGIHPFTLDMILFLVCACSLRSVYKEQGLADGLFLDTMRDLQYKLTECKQMHSVWGTSVAWWYRDFFLLRRFALGRLQYERTTFTFDEFGGVLKKGDTVYNIHIPSSGPLTPESVVDSFRKAHAFFGSELKNGILPVQCASWFMEPALAERFSETSNLKSVYRMFEILKVEKTEHNPHFWRIFGMNYSEEALKSAPERSSLQRTVKQYLLEGNCMGVGRGYLLFDGEKILYPHA